MRNPAWLALALIGATCALAAPAAGDDGLSADPPPFPERHVEPPPPPPPPLPPVWYGWEILVADIASDAALIGAAASTGNGAATPLAAFGAAGYLLGGPIIHGAHGQSKSAGISVLLRVLLPMGTTVLGVGIGAATCNDSSSGLFSGCGFNEAIVGGLGLIAGMVVAQLIDATSIAYEPAPVVPSATMAKQPLMLVLPQIGMLRDSERRTVPTMGVVIAF